MSSQHTPGPWTMETVKTQVGICHKIGPFPWKDGRQNHACIYVDYASRGPLESQLLANARLIAASPTMYAYLKRRAAAGDAEAAAILGDINA